MFKNTLIEGATSSGYIHKFKHDKGGEVYKMDHQDQMHRVGAPAFYKRSGENTTKFWQQNDELHNYDGYAVDHTTNENELKAYYLYGYEVEKPVHTFHQLAVIDGGESMLDSIIRSDNLPDSLKKTASLIGTQKLRFPNLPSELSMMSTSNSSMLKKHAWDAMELFRQHKSQIEKGIWR